MAGKPLGVGMKYTMNVKLTRFLMVDITNYIGRCTSFSPLGPDFSDIEVVGLES